MQFSRFLAPFLIPTPAVYADQQLSAVLVSVMDMPVVPAARFKGHIKGRDLLNRERCKVTLPGEILCESIIRLSDRKQEIGRNACRKIGSLIISKHFLNHRESAPRLGPATVEGKLCYNLDGFRLCHAMFLPQCQMAFQLRVQPCGKQCRNRNHAAVSWGELLFPRPNFSKEYIIIQFCKFRGKITQAISSRCLFLHRKTNPPFSILQSSPQCLQ